VGLITIRNSSAPTLDWANIETGCISLAGNVDGHTNAISVDSTVSNLVIDSDRGAGTYVAENSTVDRVIINTVGGDATIGEILIDDVDSSIGGWNWDFIRAGCIVLEASNTFGNVEMRLLCLSALNPLHTEIQFMNYGWVMKAHPQTSPLCTPLPV
jgi:hypothetical protein